MGSRSLLAGPILNPRLVPTVPVELDRQHPLAQGLRCLYLPGVSLADLANKNPISAVGGPPTSATPIGPGMNFNGFSQYLRAPGFSFTLGLPIWVSAYINTPGNNGDNTLFAVGPFNSSPRLQAHTPFSDGNLYWDCGDADSGRISASFSAFLNKWTRVDLINDGVNNKAIYFNGVLAASGTGVTPNTNTLTSLNIANWDDAIHYWVGAMTDFTIRQFYPPPQLVAWSAAEPFAMLRPIVRRSYFSIISSAFLASLADSIASSDATLGSMHATVALSAIGAATDANTSSLSATSSLTDTTASTDAKTTHAAFTSSVSDTGQTVDQTPGAGSSVASRADTVASTDLSSVLGVFAASILDSGAPSDAFFNQSIRLTDSSASSDHFSVTAHPFTVSLTDTFSSTDALFLPTTNIIDSATSSDTWTATLSITVSLTDTLIASDNLSRIVKASPQRTVTSFQTSRVLTSGPTNRTIVHYGLTSRTIVSGV